MVFLLEGPYFIIIYSLYVIGSKKKKKKMHLSIIILDIRPTSDWTSSLSKISAIIGSLN